MAKQNRNKSGKRQKPTLPDQPVLKMETVLVLEDEPKRKSRRRKSTPSPEPPRPLSEREQRKQAAWQEVEQTGKPVVFEDTLLIPSGMGPWQAIEFLPDGVREATEAAMQQTAAEAYIKMVESTRARILEETAKRDERSDYQTFSYAVQMAIADSITRRQLDLPELPIRELLKRYGASIADENDH